jgi:polysaccharide export outer membrane protein
MNSRLIKTLWTALVAAWVAVGAPAWADDPAAAALSAGEADDAPADAVVDDAGDIYRIGPGDTLVVRVVGESDLTGSFVVGPEGWLSLPMVGTMRVDGRTAAQVAGKLGRVLAKDFLVDPQVSVRVEQHASRPVQVLGAVREPGTYYLSKPTRLVELLAQAGGVLNDKSSSEVRVNHADGEASLVVQLEELLVTGEGNVLLRSGDVVNVLEGKVVYVNGEVGKPGAVAWKGGITVTRALALAGGVKATANQRKAYILRGGEKVPINLRRIFQAKDDDPVLRPGDQVLVGESAL